MQNHPKLPFNYEMSGRLDKDNKTLYKNVVFTENHKEFQKDQKLDTIVVSDESLKIEVIK
jgi:hypothetical protein